MVKQHNPTIIDRKEYELVSALANFVRICRHRKNRPARRSSVMRRYTLCAATKCGPIAMPVSERALTSASPFFIRQFRKFNTGTLILLMPTFDAETVKTSVNLLHAWKWPLVRSTDRSELTEALVEALGPNVTDFPRITSCLSYLEAPAQLLLLTEKLTEKLFK